MCLNCDFPREDLAHGPGEDTVSTLVDCFGVAGFGTAILLWVAVGRVVVKGTNDASNRMAERGYENEIEE